MKNILSIFGKKQTITNADIKKIRSADWETCAQWWNELNTWGWPEVLLPSEPPHIVGNWKPDNRRTMLMNEIDKKVGQKYLLMYLNVVKEKRMDYEWFEDFWDYSFNHDAAAGKRYLERCRKESESEK